MTPLITFCVFATSAVVIALSLLSISEERLHQLAHKKYRTPNWFTHWGCLLVLVATAIYVSVVLSGMTGSPAQLLLLLAWILGVVGFTLDRLDGKQAAVCSKRKCPGCSKEPPIENGDVRDYWLQYNRELNLPGRTQTGIWLDPLLDKVRQYPVLFFFVYVQVLPLDATLIMLLLDVTSSFMRPPFPILFQGRIHSTNASGFGKMKVTFQFTVTFLCFIAERGWILIDPWLIELTIWLAVSGAVISIVSRIKFYGPWRVINVVTDRVNVFFSHEVG